MPQDSAPQRRTSLLQDEPRQMPTVLLARGSSTPDCSLNPMACVHAPYSSGQQHKEHRCCACPAKRLRSSLLSVCVCVCVCVCVPGLLSAQSPAKEPMIF